MAESDEQHRLQQALALYQQGKLDDAARAYRRILRHNPDNLFGLFYLGSIEARRGDFAKASPLLARAVQIEPSNVALLQNYATILVQMGDNQSALLMAERAIQGNPSNPDCLHICAIAQFRLGRLKDSVAAYDGMLSLVPNHLGALSERGVAFAEMGSYDLALASFDKAIALERRFPDAHLNKGVVYAKLKRHNEALSSFDIAIGLNPHLIDGWTGRGNVLRELGRHDEALATFDKALGINPNYPLPWLGRGNCCFDLKRNDDALAAYDKALSLDSALAEAWVGRGNVLFRLRRYGDALSSYDKALSLDPDAAEAWLGRGNAFAKSKGFEEAVLAYDKAFALKPDLGGLEGVRLHSKMHLCDWDNFAAEREHLISSLKDDKANIEPFGLLGLSSSANDQLEYAQLWTAKKFPVTANPIWQGERYNHDRIRVAYISGDFRDHPVANLLAGVIEHHDRKRFEIIAVSFGQEAPSDMRTRLKASFDQFIDVNDRSDIEVATLLRSLEVDIAVDLMGYTENSRTAVFAHRAVPVQINYLGYPGTMGADYIDYIIGDRFVVPDARQRDYAEKIAYLPNSFQANDSRRKISDRTPSRAEAGLPENAVVFCSFNNTHKITPDAFDVWMRIIQRVEESVLWLLASSATVESNLRKETERRGVDAARLIFAPRVDYSDYLARYRSADLFLDTLPFNAGATASDALYAGLPIVTCSGEPFAGRMAGSLLSAIGLSALVTTSWQDYEELAVALATDSDRLAAIKRQLSEALLTTPLFDTGLFTRHLEGAYEAMVERTERGLPPDPIYVSP